MYILHLIFYRLNHFITDCMILYSYNLGNILKNFLVLTIIFIFVCRMQTSFSKPKFVIVIKIIGVIILYGFMYFHKLDFKMEFFPLCWFLEHTEQYWTIRILLWPLCIKKKKKKTLGLKKNPIPDQILKYA